MCFRWKNSLEIQVIFVLQELLNVKKIEDKLEVWKLVP